MGHVVRAPRETNIFAALVLVMADRILGVTTAATGRPLTDTTALMVLLTSLNGASQDQLGTVLGMTQSGTARLAGRLVKAGLISRSPGPDSRTSALSVTPEGRAVAQAALADRLAAVGDVADVLTAAELAQLTELAGKLLDGLARDRADALRICRMCDPVACGHYEGRCPVTNAVDRRARRGDPSSD